MARDSMMALDAVHDGSSGASRDSPLLGLNIVGVEPGDEHELPIPRKKTGNARYVAAPKSERTTSCVRLFFCFCFCTYLCSLSTTHYTSRLLIRVFAVSHAGCPAVGYVVVSRQAPVLKPEYRGLPQNEIRALVQSGQDIKESKDFLELSYTGDTSIEALLLRPTPKTTPSSPPSQVEDDNKKNDPRGSSSPAEQGDNEKEMESTPDNDNRIDTAAGNADNTNNDEGPMERSDKHLEQAWLCPTILCEATMLDDTEVARQKARERGHLHLSDIVQLLQSRRLQQQQQQQQRLILLHVSDRYDARDALHHASQAIPPEYAGLCHLSVSSLQGYDEFRSIAKNGIVRLTDYTRRQNQQQPQQQQKQRHKQPNRKPQ